MEQNGEPRNKTPIYGQLIYNKESKMYKRERKVSSIGGAGKGGQPHTEEQK